MLKNKDGFTVKKVALDFDKKEFFHEHIRFLYFEKLK